MLTSSIDIKYKMKIDLNIYGLKKIMSINNQNTFGESE